jgi:superfamily I DNA/RNA helicase
LLPAGYIAKHRKAIAEKTEQAKEEYVEEPTRHVRIKLTNFYGSKGLSALHTIVIGLNNRTFPKDPEHLSDDEACKFIVALTRARRSCSLVTNGEFNRSKKRWFNDPSEYLRLLPEELKDSKRYGLKGGELVVR